MSIMTRKINIHPIVHRRTKERWQMLPQLWPNSGTHQDLSQVACPRKTHAEHRSAYSQRRSSHTSAENSVRWHLSLACRWARIQYRLFVQSVRVLLSMCYKRFSYPTAENSGASSYSVNETFFLCRAIASARPAMPAPVMDR